MSSSSAGVPLLAIYVIRHEEVHLNLSLAHQASQQREPLKQHEVVMPPGLGLDLCLLHGHTLLVVCDYFSNYLQVEHIINHWKSVIYYLRVWVLVIHRDLWGCRCKTLLPVAAPRLQEYYYDTHSHPLPGLNTGSSVCIRLPGEKTWTPGTCDRDAGHRSYDVRVGTSTY